jgi:type II secretory pathway pseudopilin PulG
MALLAHTRQGKTAYRFRPQEKGYVLLVLLLVVAMLGITAAIALPAISFEIRRDREQEMIHRGVQYSRAIRAYYKKFGRYPTRLEDLDNTNNLRYLRKHYKDPITGQDFRLLHYGEQGVTLAGGIAGGSIPGANPIASAGGLNSTSGFSQPSAFGSSSNSAFGGSSNSAFGNNPNSAFGASAGTTFGANSNSTNGPTSSTANSAGATDPSQTSSSSNAQDSSSAKSASGSSADQSSSSQLVVSGPIVGVACVSKKTTIREFNKKKKYNEWQFVYDPTADRGGLITKPYEPLQGLAGLGQSLQPGQGTQPANSTGSSFGQPSGFGNQSSSFGNSPNSNLPTPAQPSNPPQQQ